MKAIHRVIVLFSAIACLTGGAATAAPDCSQVAALTPMQKRLAARAGDGPDALRRFVEIRQPIYQLSVADAMESAMRHGEWLASCGQATGNGATIAKSDAKLVD